MSTSSHRKHRLSQKQAREAFAAQEASEASRVSTQEGRNNSIAKTRNVSSQEPNPPAPSPSNPFPFPSSVQVTTSSLPFYATPLSRNTTAQGQLEPNEEASEPSGFLDSAAASSLSTIPSERTQPAPHRLQFTYNSLPSQATPGGPTTTVGSSAQPTSNRGASSLSFHLLHRRHSLGQVEFGTQSSPAKALNISQVVEEEHPNNNHRHINVPTTTTNNNNNNPTSTNDPNNDLVTAYTVATAVAPPSEPSADSNTTSTARPSVPLLQGRARGTQAQAQYPNLKVKVKAISEGTYLVPLRRHPPLPCLNPGQSTKLHPPLVIVAPSAEKPQALSLVSNHCLQLMRKAKNFTAGVSRSTTGKNKQRPYNRQSNNKRKRGESIEDETTSPNSANQQNNQIHVVTSFALRTLLIEDIWFIKEETPVVLFFDEEVLPPRYGKRLLTLWRETFQSEFLPAVSLQGRQYKQLTGWVHTNQATKKKITEEGVKTYDQVREAMSEFNHNGIYLRFPVFSAINCNIAFPPQDCIQKLISWFELYTYPQGVFIQADYHPKRSWLTIFKEFKAKGDDRLTLFHRIIQESPGDRFMMADLKSVWEQCQSQQDAVTTKSEYEEKLSAERNKAASQPLVFPPSLSPKLLLSFAES